MTDPQAPSRTAAVGRGAGIGLVLGVAIGAATDNVGLGIALGLVFGAALGQNASSQDDADAPKEA